MFVELDRFKGMKDSIYQLCCFDSDLFSVRLLRIPQFYGSAILNDCSSPFKLKCICTYSTQCVFKAEFLIVSSLSI